MLENTKKYIEIEDMYGANIYNPLPVVLDRGLGSTVWDIEGNKYIDFLSGYSALSLGHSHPDIIETTIRQLKTLNLTSRAFRTKVWTDFSEKICNYFGAKRVLPMNSGAEAVETAIKVARKWGHVVKSIPDGQQKIIVFEGNFHGRTTTVISFSSNHNFQHGFGPLTPGFVSVPFGDIKKVVKELLDPYVCAVLAEPIQGEGGMRVPPPGFLEELKDVCKQTDTLLIMDEIQTGLGRTGYELASTGFQVKPDLVLLGKALGGGIMPISAVMDMRGDILAVLNPGDHGSTFGGNPLAAAIASTTLDIIRRDNLCTKAFVDGSLMRKSIASVRSPIVKEIRGRGLMTGVELTVQARPICLKLMELGVLCYYTKEKILRLTPPLVITEEELLFSLDKIKEVLSGGILWTKF